MDVGANRQVQSLEVNQARPRAVQEVASPGNERQVSGSADGRRGESAATVEISASAIDAAQASAAALAAEGGVAPVASGAVAVEQSATTVPEDTASAQNTDRLQRSNVSTPATSGRASGARADMPEGVGAPEVASPQQERSPAPGVSREADPADPGISADNLGVVEDAGRPS